MSRRGVTPLAVLAGVVTLYLGVPLVAFVVRLATSPQRGFRSPGLFPALWVSLSAATISLALVTVFGVPLAYLLARSTGRIAAVVGVLVQAPLALPPIMAGIVLVYLVGPYTVVGRAFGGRLTESVTGVVIAMTFCSAPFLIVAARASFTAVDQGQLDVAATLGHGEVARFWHVAVPVARAGIRAGMVLAWLRAFAEYGAVIILAYNPASLPVYTYNQFSGVGLPTTLAPTALALGAAAVVVALSRVTLTRSAVASRRASVSPSVSPSASSRLTSSPSATARSFAPTPVRPSPVRFRLDHRLGSFHLVVEHESSASRLAIVGPSGSGKSALLRCVAGLYGPGPGPVWYGDDAVRDVSVERRRVGYVAQGFSLYPHLSVWRHLMFARGATAELAQYWMSHLRLEPLADRTPAELSGGQRQRVGLAQVLCASPQVLLLDEPFSALDEPVRRELRAELRRLQHETGLSTVLVTHDPEEAAFLSDELVVLSRGRALQTGTSRDVFSRPASPDVARLLGIANLHRATVVGSHQIAAGDALISVGERLAAPVGADVVWSVRPEDVAVETVSHEASGVDGESFYGTLADVADVGTAVELVVGVGDVELHARVRDPRDLVVGRRCRVTIAPVAIAVWMVESSPSLDEGDGAVASGPVPDGGLSGRAAVRRRRWSP